MTKKINCIEWLDECIKANKNHVVALDNFSAIRLKMLEAKDMADAIAKGYWEDAIAAEKKWRKAYDE